MEFSYRDSFILLIDFVISLILIIRILIPVETKQANVIRVLVVNEFFYLLLQLFSF